MATVVATDATREQHEEQSAVDGSPSAVPTVGSSDAGEPSAAVSNRAVELTAVDGSLLHHLQPPPIASHLHCVTTPSRSTQLAPRLRHAELSVERLVQVWPLCRCSFWRTQPLVRGTDRSSTCSPWRVAVWMQSRPACPARAHCSECLGSASRRSSARATRAQRSLLPVGSSWLVRALLLLSGLSSADAYSFAARDVGVYVPCITVRCDRALEDLSLRPVGGILGLMACGLVTSAALFACSRRSIAWQRVTAMASALLAVAALALP
eukprot:7388770-Prymnesium_polylepis.1